MLVYNSNLTSAVEVLKARHFRQICDISFFRLMDGYTYLSYSYSEVPTSHSFLFPIRKDGWLGTNNHKLYSHSTLKNSYSGASFSPVKREVAYLGKMLTEIYSGELNTVGLPMTLVDGLPDMAEAYTNIRCRASEAEVKRINKYWAKLKKKHD